MSQRTSGRSGAKAAENAAAEPNSAPGITHQVDPDFLEYLRREALDQPELPWEP